ncbi:MAG TPA: ribosome silencing factor [Syntrophobacteraceae bacterium]|nr:ribosome silencing factor [Syntrophobacteraceae bacterium]
MSLTQGPAKANREGEGLGAREKAALCAREAERFLAQDLVLLDVSGLSSFADYFILCSGKSGRQVQSIAENLEARLREHGLRPLGVEGRQEGHWILMDYTDVIIHIFYEPVRPFYDLESLWSEAKRIRTGPTGGPVQCAASDPS